MCVGCVDGNGNDVGGCEVEDGRYDESTCMRWTCVRYELV
jgi:hypothetical protein